MKLALEGYAPDLDPNTPGILVNCSAVIPTIRGIKGQPLPVATTVTSALAATSRGAATVVKLDGTTRVFAGTATALYEANGSSWTDRTRGAGAYNLGASNRWRFAQFGDTTLAVGSTASGDIIQASSSGAFADVASSPRAEIIETVGQFVFVFATNEATYGSSPDRWWCSAIGDYTLWTPSIASQSVTGRLTSAPGKITAARRFGEQIVVYKESAMYIGSYVGPPEIWRFQQVPGAVGALCQEAVVNIGTDALPRHFIVGPDDFWVFDGSRPQPVGLPLKKTVFNELSRANRANVIVIHDPVNYLVYCWYPQSSSAPEKTVIYNYKTDKWGRGRDYAINSGMEFISPSVTYDNANSFGTTYADFPSNSYDTLFATTANSLPAIFTSGNLLYSLNGTSSQSSYETGWFGDDRQYTTLSGVRPRYLLNNATASNAMTNKYVDTPGDTITTDVTSSTAFSGSAGSVRGTFHFGRSARWHRVQHDMTGDFELNALDVELIPDGAY